MFQFKELKKLLKKDLTGLTSVKVALVGDTATQFLATAIKGMGVERGYNIDLFEAEYSQVERQFMDPTSDLYQFDADFIVVFQSTHKLGEHHSLLPIEQQLTLADDRPVRSFFNNFFSSLNRSITYSLLFILFTLTNCFKKAKRYIQYPIKHPNTL